MPPEFVNILGQWGIVGLMFVMWWNERKDRLRAEGLVGNGHTIAKNVIEQNAVLIELVKSNTAAMTALKEEIKHIKHIVEDCDTRKKRMAGD